MEWLINRGSIVDDDANIADLISLYDEGML